MAECERRIAETPFGCYDAQRRGLHCAREDTDGGHDDDDNEVAFIGVGERVVVVVVQMLGKG